MKTEWIKYDGTNPPEKGHGDVVVQWKGSAPYAYAEQKIAGTRWDKSVVAYFYYSPYKPPPPPLPKCWCGGKTEEWLGTDLMKYCGCSEHGGGWGTDEATAIKNWRRMREGV